MKVFLEFWGQRLALWVKSSAENIVKYFSYFSLKSGFGIKQIVSNGDNVHDMLNHVFWGKIKKNITKLSSAELA